MRGLDVLCWRDGLVCCLSLFEVLFDLFVLGWVWLCVMLDFVC